MLPTSCEDANLSDCKIISSKGFDESDPSETEYELRRAINIVAYLAMSVGKSFYSTRTQTINIFEHLITGHNDYFLSLFFLQINIQFCSVSIFASYYISFNRKSFRQSSPVSKANMFHIPSSAILNES